MVALRLDIFETNSSSSNSIVLCDDSQYNDWQTGKLMFCHYFDSLVSFDEYYNKFIAANEKLLSNIDKFDDKQIEKAEISFNLDKYYALDKWNEVSNKVYYYDNDDDFNDIDSKIDANMSDSEIAAYYFEQSLYIDGVMSLASYLEQSNDCFEKTQTISGVIVHAVGYSSYY